MRDYRKYDVWVKAHEMCLFVYREVAVCFPKDERFELTTQIRSAAYSVPLNIVEGCGRSTDKDFAHFLDMSLGSAQEVEYCLLLGLDLGYLNNEIYETAYRKINDVKAMLIKLIKSIRATN